ncbi:MAG: hypothetical protein R6X22_04535, partial [Gemmatimonadota bacterium]
MTELAMMLAVSGAIGLQGRKVLRMRRGPRLRLRVGERRGPDRVRLENRPALRWTVRLENAGTGPATGCQALLERLKRFDGALWQQHPGFPVPIPLPWSGSGARPRLDIGPGETTGDLPILHTYPDAPKLRLAYDYLHRLTSSADYVSVLVVDEDLDD